MTRSMHIRYFLLICLLYGIFPLSAQVSYEIARDSGRRAYEALRFEDAIKQYEVAKLLAEGNRNREAEANTLIAQAQNGYIDAILASRAEAQALLLVAQAQRAIDQASLTEAYSLLAKASTTSQTGTTNEAITQALEQLLKAEFDTLQGPFLYLPLSDTLANWQSNAYQVVPYRARWALQIPNPTYTLQAHVGPVNAIEWHPTEAYFATGGDDGLIKIWDGRLESKATIISSISPIDTLGSQDLFDPWVLDLCWHPDGNYVLAAYAEGKVKAFEFDPQAKASTLIHEFQVGNAPIKSIDFSLKDDVLWVQAQSNNDTLYQVPWARFVDSEVPSPQSLLRSLVPQGQDEVISPSGKQRLSFRTNLASKQTTLALIQEDTIKWEVISYPYSAPAPIWHPDGRSFWFTDGGASLLQANLFSQKIMNAWRWEPDLISCISVDSKGKRRIIGYWNGSMILWQPTEDFSSLRQYLSLISHPTENDLSSATLQTYSLGTPIQGNHEAKVLSISAELADKSFIPQNQKETRRLPRKVLKKSYPEGMVYIPSGRAGLSGKTRDIPYFFIDDTEITNGEWQTFLNSLPPEEVSLFFPDSTCFQQDFPDLSEAGYFTEYFQNPDFREHPVVGISHAQALAYCNWRSTTETAKVDASMEEDYDIIFSYRLPTPFEWEYATYSGYETDELLSQGSEKFGTNNSILSAMAEVSNHYDRFRSNSKRNWDTYTISNPVYEILPNDYGMYGPIGNVSEMTSIRGVAKGGAWCDTKDECIKYSFGGPALYYKSYVRPHAWLGFRCVCDRLIVPKN